MSLALPSGMKLSANHFRRYRQIARLLWKYGRGDLVRRTGSNGHAEPAVTGKSPPEELADDLEAMGPTYVKLGQVLSSRPDLLPEPYRLALARLQDRVKPFSYSEVERILMDELGIRVSKAFSSFDPKPIAAASLGQVHAATLRDGRAVVVKVQRPEVGERIEKDFEVLADIAAFLDAHTELGRRHRLGRILEEFRATIRHELDYEREAHNLVTLHDNLKAFERIVVPLPVPNYCTRRVLTMVKIQGQKITSLSPVAKLEVEGSLLAEELFRAYLEQVLVDGFFHADPHPGNVFLSEEGRIALLDLGMVGTTTPAMQEHLLRLLMAIMESKVEQAADIVIGISEKSDAFDPEGFRRRVAQLLLSRQDRSLERLEVGRSLMELSGAAGKDGLFVPSELVLLGKTLLQLDEIGRALDPRFDPNASVRRNVGQILRRRMTKNSTQGGLFSSILETKEFVRSVPTRLGRILDAVANAELEVQVKSLDARRVVESIEKVANRITVGLVLAALIVGAALLMRVETSFRIYGYPGFAMVCFLIAAAGGFWLVASTFLRDHKSAKPRRD